MIHPETRTRLDRIPARCDDVCVSRSDADLPSEALEQVLVVVRGHRVILDADAAALFGVETKALNRAVKRNLERFPADFMLQLTVEEFDALRYQSGTSNAPGRGGRRYLPYAFTEHGVAMLSGVLNSAKAVAVSIEIIRAFIRLRQLLSENAGLARKINQLEKRYDEKFKMVFDAIRGLMHDQVKLKTKLVNRQETSPRRRIGFHK